MKSLADAINETLLRKRAGGVFDAAGCASSVVQGLALEDPDQWAVIRDQIVLDTITAAIQRRLQRLIEKTDERQGWLALPEYERIPQLIKLEDGFVDVNDATLEQYRESEAELSVRIKSYDYPRRSKEKLKRDKETLAQMRKVDRRVAPLMASDPEMKIGRAIGLHQASLEKPARQQRRKAAKRATQRRWART